MAEDYVELADLKETLSLNGAQTYADDDIERAITAASRAIDKHCRRRFYLDTDATQVRYFTPDSTAETPITDLVELTRVEIDTSSDGTFSTEWTENTDFVCEPLNAAADDEPYTLLSATGGSFPRRKRAVKVTGRFGWPEVPAPIVDAASIIAAKLVRRKREAPSGAPSGGFNNGDSTHASLIVRKDPDVSSLLEPYVNYAG